MTRTTRLLVALLLIGAAACARSDEEADRAPARPADQPGVASTEEDPHAGHDMTAAVDSADEHADHAAGGARPGTVSAADPHAEHTAAPARSGVTAAADPHAAHTAVAARPGAATAADPHAQHGTAGGQRPTAEGADQMAHELLIELARSLVADSVVQRRIRADSALRVLWADSSVKRHILSTEPQEQR